MSMPGVMNLVFNARDAMPSGWTISVLAQNRALKATSQDLAPGEYVVVTVKDTGSGIPSDILAKAKVIEPFFTTKPVGKGNGARAQHAAVKPKEPRTAGRTSHRRIARA